MGLQAGKIFVNLPVKELEKSIAFFETIGFSFHDQFTDDKAACLIVNKDTYVMLIVEDFYQSYTNKAICDSIKSTEVTVTLSADSRQKVNDLVNQAVDAGANPLPEPVDFGLTYQWGFKDLDGNVWEVSHMNEDVKQ